MTGELVGTVVRLRPVTHDDQSALVAIRKTPEVFARWRGEDLDAEFLADVEDDDAVRLTIEEAASGRIVGLIQFAEEDEPEYRHASIDIYVAPEVHRRGIATDAIRRLVRHLFDDLGHHRITIDPAADNEAAIRCYQGVGFRPVGVLREYERQADGSWGDGLLMELLRSAN